MALTDIYSLVHGNVELQQRFEAARIKASWDVLNEDESTTNHAERLIWANGIIGNTKNNINEEYVRFLSNSTIQSEGNAATDSDIQFVVNSLVNTYAGV